MGMTSAFLYLIVKLHSLCKVSVGFSLKCSTGYRFGPNFTTKDATNNIIILQRSVKAEETKHAAQYLIKRLE